MMLRSLDFNQHYESAVSNAVEAQFDALQLPSSCSQKFLQRRSEIPSAPAWTIRLRHGTTTSFAAVKTPIYDFLYKVKGNFNGPAGDHTPPEDILTQRGKDDSETIDKEWARVHWCEDKIKELECAKHQHHVDDLHKKLEEDSAGDNPDLWSTVDTPHLKDLGKDLGSEAPFIKQCGPFLHCASEKMKASIPDKPTGNDEKPDNFFFENIHVGWPAEMPVPVRGRIDFRNNEVVAALGDTKLPPPPPPPEPFVINKTPHHWIVKKTKKKPTFDWGRFQFWDE
ncbi:unnamed protein product [Amoebophrya sp. A120]|nr:unnamed protein product [Amoebophrya sp. A120]|eukprot:GSA120T00002336001.1